jgi:hypothetical protein
MRTSKLAAAFAIGSIFGCAATARTAAGSKVLPVTAPPSADCTNLGQVIGQGGGFWTGGITTNEDLALSAINDASNKAAALGATHIQSSAPQFAAGEKGTTNSATVVGIAYKCPGGAGAPQSAAVPDKAR